MAFLLDEKRIAPDWLSGCRWLPAMVAPSPGEVERKSRV